LSSVAGNDSLRENLRAASDHRKWFALALLCAVQFMVMLDRAIVNVAPPSIQVELGFSQGRQWECLSAQTIGIERAHQGLLYFTRVSADGTHWVRAISQRWSLT
jgi:hypothetical protein